MVTYYMTIKNGHVWSLQTSENSKIEYKNQISKQEYERILKLFQNKPVAENGFEYVLKDDMTWELIEAQPAIDAQIPIYTEAELAAMSNAELEAILSNYGLTIKGTKENLIKLILKYQEN